MYKKTSRKQKALNNFKTFLYSKLLTVIILLFAQLIMSVMFFVKLGKYIEIYVGLSLVLSTGFMIYIVNTEGKNEFKIVWLFPVLLLPIFGISFYFLYKTNVGGRHLQKKLAEIKRVSKVYMNNPVQIKKALELYPKCGDIARYLEKSGNYTVYTNTKTTYFSSGEKGFADILKELKRAEHFVFMEFFIIEDSFMLEKILEILTEKAKNGVEVRIIFDSLGSVGMSAELIYKLFPNHKMQVKEFMPFIPVFDTGLNSRDHRKLIIIDGKTAYTGGINISDEYINKIQKRFSYWKDNVLKLNGPAVKTLTIMFLQQWMLMSKKGEKDLIDFGRFSHLEVKDEIPDGAVIPYGDDAYNREDIAENVYNYIISKAHDYVHIITPYLVIDNTLLEALIFAAKRGVEVSIILPEKYDHFITCCVGRTYIRTLIKSGVNVYFYKTGFVHSKIFISDDKRAVVGSINLDYRSLYHHFECGIYLYGSTTIAEVEEDFQTVIKDSEKITKENYKNIPLLLRFFGFLLRIFAPLL